jgi:hypothetical protein
MEFSPISRSKKEVRLAIPRILETRRITSWILLLFVMAGSSPKALWAGTARLQYDLIVYGATASGVATAVAASRNGLHVAIVDPSHHVGGMVAGGLSSSDHGNVSVVGGIAHEFFARVGEHYGELIEWNFEPHVASLVFNNFLAENHVDTYFDSPILEHGGVTKTGNHISSITTSGGTIFGAALFADCTYEGELMGLAGVSYTWGRESQTDYDESLAGVQLMQRPEHMFTVPVSPYGANGYLLPGVQPVTDSTIGDGDKKVQAYGFRMCITNQQSNMIPFPKPAHYDPARYEILARLVEALTKAKGGPPTMKEMMLISKLKGDKLDINNRGAVSTDHIGANWDYPSASAKQRMAIWQDHYNYDAGFFYYLGHSDRIPKSLQDEVNSYGLAKDEFTDTNGWPWQLYVREGRRMVGEYVMTQHDIQENLTKKDSIGMGSYQSDSHNVERIPTKNGAVQNEGEMYVPVKPYQIPYRMMLPKRSEAENLLVPVCFSASHVAYSTVRMEPQYMIIGQAAGVAAALAIHGHTSIYDISIPELQGELEKEHGVLRLPAK